MGIELERTVESIQVGHRHRADLGDIEALAASIQEHGLLQPITVTPEGVLVCGRRRLASEPRDPPPHRLGRHLPLPRGDRPPRRRGPGRADR